MHRAQRMLAAASFAVSFAFLASAGFAQQPETVRVRGTVEQADGNVLTVKTREGQTVKLVVADNATVRGVVRIPLSDLKPGVMVGVAAMPQPDGSQRALEVHVFPAGLRVTESHTPYDLQPQSTMTNAAVESSVASVDGQVLTVKYKQGDKVEEKRILVPGDAPIVTYVPGDKSELKAGAKIMIFRALKQPDGTLQADSISVGRDGLTPPM